MYDAIEIDIVAFIPEKAVDPLYYDKAYFLAPDKRGAKPYNLLMEAMRNCGAAMYQPYFNAGSIVSSVAK